MRIIKQSGLWEKGTYTIRIAFTLTLVVLGYVIYNELLNKKNEALQTYRVELIERGFAIQQRGVLDSVDAVPAIVPVNDYISEIVEQGTSINKGEQIFLMDSAKTLASIADNEIKYLRYEVEVKALQARYAFTEQRERARYAIAKAESEHAQLELEHALNLPDADQLRRLEIDRQLAIFDLEDAQSELQRNQRLYDKQFISVLALEPFERAVATAQVYLDEIELEIKIRKKGIQYEQRVQLERNAAAAKAKLARHEKRMNRLLNIINIEIDMMQKLIARTKHKVAHLKQQLEQVSVRANTDGVVRILNYYDWSAGGRLVPFQPGVERWPQDVIAEIIDPTKMKITLAIHESDLHWVHTGMDVTIEVFAYPGRLFAGKLKNLGSIGRDRSRIDPLGKANRISGVMVYNAEVEFDTAGLACRPGMSAMVAVQVIPVAPRLLIPRSALSSQGDKHTVYVKHLMHHQPVAIAGHVFDELYFEVTEGLEVGDVIIANLQLSSKL